MAHGEGHYSKIVIRCDYGVRLRSVIIKWDYRVQLWSAIMEWLVIEDRIQSVFMRCSGVVYDVKVTS